MERDLIIKALECCTSTDKTANCPIGCPFGDINSCEESLMYHALALIESQEERIKNLTIEIVRKMHDRLIECFDNEIEHKSIYTERQVLFSIDQIAKEMLEGEA